jgi:hypothetical protein
MFVVFSVALPVFALFANARIRWADLALLAATVLPSLQGWIARLCLVRKRIGIRLRGDDT